MATVDLGELLSLKEVTLIHIFEFLRKTVSRSDMKITATERA